MAERRQGVGDGRIGIETLAQRVDAGPQRRLVAEQLVVLGDESLQIVALVLQIEQQQLGAHLGIEIGRVDGEEVLLLALDVEHAPVTPIDDAGRPVARGRLVGRRRHLLGVDARLHQLAQVARQPARALDLGGSQLPSRLGLVDLVHEVLEPTDLGPAQRAHLLERFAELAELTGLDDEMVLELLLDHVQLRLGVIGQRGRFPLQLLLGLEELDLSAELLDLGPFEVQVERLEGILELPEPLLLACQADIGRSARAGSVRHPLEASEDVLDRLLGLGDGHGDLELAVDLRLEDLLHGTDVDRVGRASELPQPLLQRAGHDPRRQDRLQCLDGRLVDLVAHIIARCADHPASSRGRTIAAAASPRLRTPHPSRPSSPTAPGCWWSWW